MEESQPRTSKKSNPFRVSIKEQPVLKSAQSIASSEIYLNSYTEFQDEYNQDSAFTDGDEDIHGLTSFDDIDTVMLGDLLHETAPIVLDDDADEDDYDFGVDIKNMRAKGLPKMKSRLAMSNQQVLDLIDPNNQKVFNDNISRLNVLLESTQKEYCIMNYKGHNPEANTFRLTRSLLSKLIYQDELDLPGNLLQQTVGRRLNDQDMQDIAEFLTTDREVNRLNLAYNNITDEGGMILAGLLLIRNDILHVNLAHNDFTPTGCFHFTEYLLQRPPLHSLKLAGMKIGREGFNGLICLVMCGRGPYDLDVSETDMTMQEFQGLCSAWQAIDRDQDYPKYLMDHPLPIPLGALADMKVANNEAKRKEHSLIQRRSIVELIRKGAGDIRTMEKIPDFPPGEMQDPVELVEKVNATLLEGLFEIPELKLEERKLLGLKSNLDKGQTEVDKIRNKADNVPDTGLVIEEFNKIKESGCIPIVDGRPVIVCPSLYSLEADNVLDTEAGKTGHLVPSVLDNLLEEAQYIANKEGRSNKAPDDETASKAPNKVVDRVLKETAQFSSITDYEEKSDSTQVLLATVLATCQKVQEMEDSSYEIGEEDLQMIWESATETAVEIIYNRIPEESCSWTPNQVTAFVRKFMLSANRTLLTLLRNPFIPPLLYDVGTQGCRETVDQESARPLIPLSYNSPDSADQTDHPQQYNYAQKIVISFLEGAITEAANLIGSGDPYSFKQQTRESLGSALEKSEQLCEETEEHVEGLVKNFILAGACISEDARTANKELDVVVDTATDPALYFLEETFDKVADLIIETEQARRDVAASAQEHILKFPYVSRPTRLVLNRPLFQDFEHVMAAKMGDFLAQNTTLKCLHMRKWNLIEDGMINLTDGLALNSNIVLLDLTSNGIGAEGAKGLAKFIKNNNKLRHLILSHNRLRNPGMTYLTEALINCGLNSLNIAYNDISESLDNLLHILPTSKIRSLYALGNHFSQTTWKLLKNLMDSQWLLPEHCDFTLQEIDGKGAIVKNAQIRDTNEWYDVPPTVAKGLHRAPYFEENAHITSLKM